MLRLSVMVFVLVCGGAGAQPLRVFAAGSLSGASGEIIAKFDPATRAEFGPSGVLRQRIAAGDAPDVFASADMGHPRKLAAARGLGVTLFARNALCVQGRAGLTEANVLDRMLDPALVLATSTPVADPGGDYAWAALPAEVPGLVSVSVPVPAAMAPRGAERPEYGLVVRSGSVAAARFRDFVLSPTGQGILARYGFQPVGPVTE